MQPQFKLDKNFLPDPWDTWQLRFSFLHNSLLYHIGFWEYTAFT